jgi:isoprenylcysteine carboxyl methyltransferase (ICMT) family protein YpbQ
MFFGSPNNVLFPGEIVPDPNYILKIIGILFIIVMYLQSWYGLFFFFFLGE